MNHEKEMGLSSEVGPSWRKQVTRSGYLVPVSLFSVSPHPGCHELLQFILSTMTFCPIKGHKQRSQVTIVTMDQNHRIPRAKISLSSIQYSPQAFVSDRKQTQTDIQKLPSKGFSANI